MKKIVFAGSHGATTAVSIIQELKKIKPINWQISWIGARRAFEGIFPKLGVAYYSVDAGRLQMKFSVWTLPAILKVPYGLIQAYFLMRKIKPDVVFSLGGSVGFLACLCGFLLRTRVLVHEQTFAAGRANLLSSPFATKILLARGESGTFFPKRKTVLVGNPIRKSIKRVKPKRSIGNPPVLLVLGGSRGSKVLNKLLEQILPELLKNYHIIHQTGELDYGRFLTLRQSFDKSATQKYKVVAFIKDVAQTYINSDIIVSRAGANIVSEIMAVHRPAVLIPIPWTYKDEQVISARIAQNCGISVTLNQNKISPGRLLKTIEIVRSNWQGMANSSVGKYTKLDFYSSRLICKIILSSLA